MSKSYIVKTRTGKLYELEDESHAFHPDTWFITIDGKRNVVLYFGKLRERIAGPIMAAHGKRDEISITPLAGKVDEAVAKGTCIGQCVFYVDERIMLPYLKSRNIPSEIWTNVISKNIGNTSELTAVYVKLH